jgi:hypothetical protein
MRAPAPAGTRYLLLATAATLLAGTAAARASAVTDTLYFTTFSGGQNIWSSTATYNGDGSAGNGSFTVTTPSPLATTPGADGIVENPNNGQLLVGGQNTGNIYQVNPVTGSYTTLNAGMNTYEITVGSNGNHVYGGGSEGGASTITRVPINPAGGAPTVVAVSGASTSVTHITFAPGLSAGTAFYTDGSDSGAGDFGTINLATGVTTALLTNVPYAHGMVYDPFTGDLILAGGDMLAQVSTAGVVQSTLTLTSGQELDQGAVTGNGQLYWADNTGKLVFVDYANTGNIGSANDFVSNNFFISSLDDIAPLVGSGGTNNVPEPATLGLLGFGVAALAALRRHARPHA